MNLQPELNILYMNDIHFCGDKITSFFSLISNYATALETDLNLNIYLQVMSVFKLQIKIYKMSRL